MPHPQVQPPTDVPQVCFGQSLASGVFQNASVRAWMSWRTGGVSSAPCDSWNLGDHVGDAAESVAANRRLLAQRLGALGPSGSAVQLAWARQVHGVGVARTGEAGAASTPQADALLTTEPGVVCCMLVADCLPVLFAHRQRPLVAAAHAGWRGLCGQGGVGVLETTLAAMADTAKQPLAALVREVDVWLGPCIGPRAFEVGPEVRAAFVQAHEADEGCFTEAGRPGKFWADLPALARARLARSGVGLVQGNDGGPDWCTYTQAQRYFSHRRDAAALGSTGRMAACIWLDGDSAL